MTASSDVTIVVCTRERPALLAGALTAIRSNSPLDADVLVVDSGSTTSATGAVALAAGVRAVRSDIPGLSIARNLGLRTAARPIVVFTDDDCEPEPGWVDALIEGFGAHPNAGAVTGLLLDPHAPAPEPAPLRRLTRTRDGLDAGHGAIMAFNRELVLGLGGFDEVLGAGRRAAGAEDLDMLCRVLAAGHAVIVAPAARVRHVLRREDDAYLDLNVGYGRGLGAMAVKWIRRRTSTGLTLLAVMVARALRRAARGRRDPRLRSGAFGLLGGIRVGIAEQLRTPVRGETFVDLAPPAPVRLVADPMDAG